MYLSYDNYSNSIKFLREKIAQRIFLSMNHNNFLDKNLDKDRADRYQKIIFDNPGYNQASIAVALLVGWQNYIPKDLMNDINCWLYKEGPS